MPPVPLPLFSPRERSIARRAKFGGAIGGAIIVSQPSIPFDRTYSLRTDHQPHLPMLIPSPELKTPNPSTESNSFNTEI